MLTFDGTQPGYDRFQNRFKHVFFCIRDNDSAPLHVTDFEKPMTRLDQPADTSSRVFLELATSQAAMNNE